MPPRHTTSELFERWRERIHAGSHRSAPPSVIQYAPTEKAPGHRPDASSCSSQWPGVHASISVRTRSLECGAARPRSQACEAPATTCPRGDRPARAPPRDPPADPPSRLPQRTTSSLVLPGLSTAPEMAQDDRSGRRCFRNALPSTARRRYSSAAIGVSEPRSPRNHVGRRRLGRFHDLNGDGGLIKFADAPFGLDLSAGHLHPRHQANHGS